MTKFRCRGVNIEGETLTTLEELQEELRSYILVHAYERDYNRISTIEKEVLTTEFILLKLSEIIDKLDTLNNGPVAQLVEQLPCKQ